MAEVNLSKAVRSNLLSLQSTANAMAKTQERLATGLKVNSALDNPTNFFTAGALNSRASDMANLLDSMSNGIKTIEAANNGLSAITKTVEQMQSTLRQARQDKSFKTGSFNLALPTTPTGTEQLSISGGAVGSTAVDVALTTNTGGTPVAATAGSITGGAFTNIDFAPAAATAGTVSGAAFGAPIDFTATPATEGTNTFAFAGDATAFAAGDQVTITLNVDGAGPVAVTIDQAIVAGVGNNDNSIDDIDEFTAALNAAIGASALSGDVVASNDGTNVTLTSATTGTSSTVAITAVNGDADGGDEDFGATPFGATVAAGTAGEDAITPTLTFDVDIDGSGSPTTVTIDAAAVAAVGNNDNVLDDISELQAIVDAQLGAGVTVGTDAGALTFTSATTGASSEVDIANVAVSGGIANTTGIAAANDTGSDAGAARTITFDLIVDGGTATPITIDLAAVQAEGDNNSTATAAELAAIINDQAGAAIASVGGGGELVFTSTTTGAASSVEIDNFAVTGGVTGSGIADGSDTGTAASISGGTTAVKTVDALVAEINANTSLNAAVRASNDNGKLRIENLSTEALSIVGVSTTSGEVNGGTGASNTTEIGGNDVRKNLVKQFNELRDQLDKLADDASFNGINLLRGDKLKITFNETGTSTIDIQAKDADGQETAINNTELGIDAAVDADFDSDTSIDELLTTLSGALGSLRSQASGFGSNLSIVQNRQDFTKNMINTLETGAANLTLADTNEEAANLLALQTRQQLSSTALSLASQADQQVLRLF